MIIYEVTAEVENGLNEAYEAFMMDRHIPDVLATGHFVSATIARSGARYQIRYEAVNRATLEDYFTMHTERLRADLLAHFPSGVSLSRDVWDVLRTYAASDKL